MTKCEVCRTQFPLDKVLEKPKAPNISTVTLGKLSTLEGDLFSISRNTILLAKKLGVGGRGRFLALPRRHRPRNRLAA